MKLGHVLSRERKVKDLDVVSNALRRHALGHGAAAALNVPAEHNLRRRLAVP